MGPLDHDNTECFYSCEIRHSFAGRTSLFNLISSFPGITVFLQHPPRLLSSLVNLQASLHSLILHTHPEGVRWSQEASREAVSSFTLTCMRNRPSLKSIYWFIPTESNRILFLPVSTAICPSTSEVIHLSRTFPNRQHFKLHQLPLSSAVTSTYSFTEYMLSTCTSQVLCWELELR